MLQSRWSRGLVAVVCAGCLTAGVSPAQDVSRPILDAQWKIVLRPAGAIVPVSYQSADDTPAIVSPLTLELPVQKRPTEGAVTPQSPITPAAPPTPTSTETKADMSPVVSTTADESHSGSPGNGVQWGPQPAGVTCIGQSRLTYTEAYQAIPFSRTEYEANPGYRHQAAMELLFGTMRPTTMVQQYSPRVIRYPDAYLRPYGRTDAIHVNVRNFGGSYPRSPWGYPYGLSGN